MVSQRRRLIRRVNRSMRGYGVSGRLVWGLRSFIAAMVAVGAGWLVREWLGLALTLIVGLLVWLVAISWWMRQ